MSEMETIGFIGLGVMGKPMAGHLLAKGYRLVVHSRSRGRSTRWSRPGAVRAGAPADVAAQARRIITMLPDSPDVELVLDGPDGVFSRIQPGTIVIDTSSIAPGRRPGPRGEGAHARGDDARCAGQRRRNRRDQRDARRSWSAATRPRSTRSSPFWT